MNLSLSHKHAFVAGSTQGIGKAAALELAALGAHVTLIARNETALQATLQELDTTQGQQHSYLVADFSQPETLKAALAANTRPIHILVNNTGGPAAGPITEATPEAFLAAFQQHLVCNHLLVQAALPSMKAAAFGRVINVISTSVKAPLDNLGVSNTIRAAVANWAKTLANEVGKFGITVNNVLPGATATERLAGIIRNKSAKTNTAEDHVRDEMIAEIPAGRIGEAHEVAAAIAFLASPAAAYINGINLPVDGGRTRNL